MIKKQYINEVFILRAVACLSIVLLHSIGRSQLYLTNFNDYSVFIISSVRTLLTFGTPTFIFISILLISYSYPSGVQSNFLRRRGQLILLPYISMAVFYAVFYGFFSSSTIKQVLTNVLINISGGYHGYFVLIIFQFYLLYVFFNDYLSRQRPLKIMLLSLVVNLLYLAVFNFTNSPVDNIFINYFWERGHWIPFIGWIFYFTVAYYCGRNYSAFLLLVNSNIKIILASLVVTGSITIALVNLEIMPLSSKSITMVFFTTSAIGVIYFLANKTTHVPYLLMLISRYSFSIYLLHMVFFDFIIKILKLLEIHWGGFYIAFLFIGSITGSVITAYLINKVKLGKYIVGSVSNVGIVTKIEKSVFDKLARR